MVVADVSVDFSVLSVVSADIQTVARSIATTGDPGVVNVSAVGSDAVAAVLARVGVEQTTRAATAAEGLRSVGHLPAAAAEGFAGLDRGLVSPY